MQWPLWGEHIPVNSRPWRTQNETVGCYCCWFPTSTKWCDNHKTQINQAGTELEASSLLADPHRPRRCNAGCPKSGRLLGSLPHRLGSWARPGSCCCCFAPWMWGTRQMAVYKLSVQGSLPLWSEKTSLQWIEPQNWFTCSEEDPGERSRSTGKPQGCIELTHASSFYSSSDSSLKKKKEWAIIYHLIRSHLWVCSCM